ncbi:MAG: hypothetical protein WDN06_08105 [Asticcacaulis sp.]
MKKLADTIWFNGKIVPWEDANVHVMTHALHYGTSVFEGIRAYDTPPRPGRLPPDRPPAPPGRFRPASTASTSPSTSIR